MTIVMKIGAKAKRSAEVVPPHQKKLQLVIWRNSKSVIFICCIINVTNFQGAKRGGGGGYTRPIKLSAELAAVVGEESMPRHEVVKRIWAIIKERNLYVCYS